MCLVKFFPPHCRGYYHRSKYCLSIRILLSLNNKKKKKIMLWYHLEKKKLFEVSFTNKKKKVIKCRKVLHLS